MLVLSFDGLFRPLFPSSDPQSGAGLMCYGWLITRKGVILAHGHGAFARAKDANSNLAEYLALIEGLDAAFDLLRGDELVQVRGDAKSVIDQMRGAALVASERVKPLYLRAQRLADRLPRVEWVWTPRKDNRLADALSRRALRQMRRDRASYQMALSNLLGQVKAQNRLLPVLDLRYYPAAQIS